MSEPIVIELNNEDMHRLIQDELAKRGFEGRSWSVQNFSIYGATISVLQ